MRLSPCTKQEPGIQYAVPAARMGSGDTTLTSRSLAPKLSAHAQWWGGARTFLGKGPIVEGECSRRS